MVFGEPILAASFLCANGAVLLAAERLTQRQRHVAVARMPGGGTLGATAWHGDGRGNPARHGAPVTAMPLRDMTFRQALVIGCAQSFALLPGISRSGTTMVAGLANGLDLAFNKIDVSVLRDRNGNGQKPIPLADVSFLK